MSRSGGEDQKGRDLKPHRVYLGIGSNLGQKEENCRTALEKLAAQESIHLRACSSFYRTAPWGVKEQDWFVNLVVSLDTSLDPGGMMEVLKRIEGESQNVPKEKWGPRYLDLDILFFDNMVLNEPQLVIPHPYLHLRTFVLVPFMDIDPTHRHPVLQKTVAQLLDELQDPQEVQPLAPAHPLSFSCLPRERGSCF